MPWTGRWEGGKIWTARSGRQTYYVWKVIDGKHHKFSTNCHDLASALKFYLDFMGSPDERGGAAGGSNPERGRAAPRRELRPGRGFLLTPVTFP